MPSRAEHKLTELIFSKHLIKSCNSYCQNVCDFRTFFATVLSAKAAGDRLESWLVRMPIERLIGARLFCVKQSVDRGWRSMIGMVPPKCQDCGQLNLTMQANAQLHIFHSNKHPNHLTLFQVVLRVPLGRILMKLCFAKALPSDLRLNLQLMILMSHKHERIRVTFFKIDLLNCGREWRNAKLYLSRENFFDNIRARIFGDLHRYLWVKF